MTSEVMLDGSMVPRFAKRHVDERTEPRSESRAETGVLELRGRKHVVRLVNTSSSGAMIILSLIPNIGEAISVQLAGRGLLSGRVCWVRDGRIGVTFADSPE
ncbi:MAG TPA: PilZ domain-containing protein [Sphingomicrobium sp.]|nr:PilZ domain-containing protein [Sphingomicrobium sp.]